MSFYRGYAALPEFTGAGSTAAARLSVLSDPISTAQKLQSQYAKLFQTAEGAAAADEIQKLEGDISSTWTALVEVGARKDSMGPRPAAASPTESISQAVARDNWYAQLNEINAGIKTLSLALQSGLAEYNSRVPELAEKVQGAINARPVATEVHGETMEQVVQVTDDGPPPQIQPAYASSWLDLTTGGVKNRYLVYGGVGVGVLAIAAVVLLGRKKKKSVAGYRKRRR